MQRTKETIESDIAAVERVIEISDDSETVTKLAPLREALKVELSGAPDAPRLGFTKLKREPGEPWGVRWQKGTGSKPEPGETYTVTTRAGKSRSVTIDREVVEFDDAVLFAIVEDGD